MAVFFLSLALLCDLYRSVRTAACDKLKICNFCLRMVAVSGFDSSLFTLFEYGYISIVLTTSLFNYEYLMLVRLL